MDQFVAHIADEAIVCRCERVTAGEIRALIRQGYRDLQRDQGRHPRRHGRLRLEDLLLVDPAPFPRRRHSCLLRSPSASRRPLFVEVPLKSFAGIDKSIADEP